MSKIVGVTVGTNIKPEKVIEKAGVVSQGRSAKYSFTTPGWKRVLNIIRTSGGMVNFGISQTTPLYMAQAAGICFSGFVKYGEDTSTDAKPVLYQMYNNIFGEDDALENPGRITQVRIGYPDPTQDNYNNGTANAIRNPVNCYLDVYVDFDKDALNSGTVGFNINYSGFADSHNCEAITVETEAVDTGIYGEELEYYTLTLKDNGGMYMPDDTIEADEVKTRAVEADTLTASTVNATTIPKFVRISGATGDVAISNAVRTGDEPGKYGFWLNGRGTSLLIAAATEDDIDEGTSRYKPIVPFTAKYAVEKYTADLLKRIAALEETAKTITFSLFCKSINHFHTFTAEKGMTWEQFIASDYYSEPACDGDFTSFYVEEDGTVQCVTDGGDLRPMRYNYAQVYGTDTIIAGAIYAP